MNEDRVRQIIREELSSLIGSDRYTFQKHLQIFDGRNIQLGKTTGTKIGLSDDEKLGFYGVDPIVREAKPANANNVGATYSQSEVQNIADTVNSVMSDLVTVGLYKL